MQNIFPPPSVYVVRHVLNLLAAPQGSWRPVSGPYEQTIVSLHRAGKTIKEISDRVGWNFDTV